MVHLATSLKQHCRMLPLALLIVGMAARPVAAVAGWGAPQQLTAGGTNWYYALAAGADIVHFAYGDGTISYRRSTDEGVSWSPPTALASGRLYLEDPLVADGSNVYLVYFRNLRTVTDFLGSREVGDIYLRASRDGGTTWNPEVQLTTAQAALRLSLAASGPRVHLTWMDYRSGKWDVYYRRSPDGGLTWEAEVRLVTGTNAVGAGRPQTASVGESVHVTWMDARDNLPTCAIEGGTVLPVCTEIYYKRSLDGGRTWGPDVRMTRETAYSGRPEIVAASNTVLVSYDQMEGASGLEVYLARSADNGTTWAAPQRMSVAAGHSTHSSMLAAGSTVHLAWHDMRNASNTEVYYRSSTNAGQTWDAEQLIAPGAGDSLVPFLGVTSRYVHVAWGDARSGSMQGWYSRAGSGAPAPPPSSPCHVFQNGVAVPGGFGVPWNVFAPAELVLQARCSGATRTAQVGSTGSPHYLWPQGYAWTGSAWQPFTFTCAGPLTSGWCSGSGSAPLPAAATYYNAYTCQLQHGAWKCGCRDAACTQSFWQLQGVQ